MKTKISQIYTIVGFFTATIGTTLAVSWVMTNILFDDSISEIVPVKVVIIKQAQKNIDLSKSLRLFIPKLR